MAEEEARLQREEDERRMREEVTKAKAAEEEERKKKELAEAEARRKAILEAGESAAQAEIIQALKEQLEQEKKVIMRVIFVFILFVEFVCLFVI